MKWSPSEIIELSPILDQLRSDLEPLNGKNILVLCSAAGEVPFWLAKRMSCGYILGVELDRELLETAQHSLKEKQLSHLIEFRAGDKTRLPTDDNRFDALISEYVIFPTPAPTEIEQPEMARVLKPGGKMLITDVITTKPLALDIRAELDRIGLDYLCEGTADDFRSWMEDAGLIDIEIKDLTPTVKRVWEHRRKQDPAQDHRKGYSLLFEDSLTRLGDGLYYIFARGTKPRT